MKAVSSSKLCGVLNVQFLGTLLKSVWQKQIFKLTLGLACTITIVEDIKIQPSNDSQGALKHAQFNTIVQVSIHVYITSFKARIKLQVSSARRPNMPWGQRNIL